MRKTILSTLLLSLSFAMSAQSYQQIEATEYDPTQDRWLTTNGSSIIAQAADGELSFFGDATANYGMEVMNGTLFAIYNSAIKGYDLVTAEEVMSINIPGAGFLNGMGSDPSTNRLWVSDFQSNKIIELDVSDLSSPTQQTVVSNTGSTPNGVVYDQIDDRLIFVSWGGNAAIKAVDLSDYSVSTLLNTGLSNIDGIDMNATGRFYVSSWSPTRITQYEHDFTSPVTVPATGLSNPADISFGNEINTLGVANSGNETLSLITFDPNSLDEELVSAFALQVFPNPVSSGSLITFNLPASDNVELKIRDIQGRLVEKLVNGDLLLGQQQLMIDGAAYEEGFYLIELLVNGMRITAPFVVAR